MELEINKKILNPLLSRMEVEGTIFSENTPSYEDAKKELADNLGVSPDLIVIKNIYQKYGQFKSSIIAFIYQSKEAMQKFEKTKEKKITEEKDKKSKEKK